MDIDFTNLDDIDIDKEGITRKKFNKYIVIVPTFSILVSLVVVIISFYYLIKGIANELGKYNNCDDIWIFYCNDVSLKVEKL